MPSLDNEALERAQLILHLPSQRKNITNLVTTSALIEAGFLSPMIGTKVGPTTFRNGRPLKNKGSRVLKAEPEEYTSDAASPRGGCGRARTTQNEGAPLFQYAHYTLFACVYIPFYSHLWCTQDNTFFTMCRYGRSSFILLKEEAKSGGGRVSLARLSKAGRV